MAKKYVVVCHHADCGDDEVFLLNERWWNTRTEARSAMKSDYMLMCEAWDTKRGKKDGTVHKVGQDEICMSIPAWNAETDSPDTLNCRWVVVVA